MDEGQYSVNRNHVDKLRELSLRCVAQAGRYLKMECPLDSECKIGINWSQTH